MASETSGVKIRHRLIAIFYDALIVFFIMVLSTFIIQQIMLSTEIVPLEQVQISETETIKVIPSNSASNWFLKSLWPILSFLYFGYYWTTRGQTPGMRVWNMKLINKNESTVSWIQALIRYVSALFGIGLIWILFNRKRYAIQDIISASVIVKT